MAKTPEFDIRKPKKNYFINGDMSIAQRNTSFAAAANGTYSVDRFQYVKTGAMVHTLTQDTDVPTFAQAGYLFRNSVRLNLTTPDTSIAAGDYCGIGQIIEGYNWKNLAQKPFTISFWVKATLPGVYCLGLQNSIADRGYAAEYTIDVANTWEYKTVTIPASVSAGTWNYTNGVGLKVWWTLAAGSTFHFATGSWQTGTVLSTANQVNGVNTGSTDFRITGTVINEGYDALAFKPFAEDFEGELSACQRYFEKSYNLTIPVSSSTEIGKQGENRTTTGIWTHTHGTFATCKRIDPIFVLIDIVGNLNRVSIYTEGADARTDNASYTGSVTAGNSGWFYRYVSGATGVNLGYHFTADAELS